MVMICQFRNGRYGSVDSIHLFFCVWWHCRDECKEGIIHVSATSFPLMVVFTFFI